MSITTLEEASRIWAQFNQTHGFYIPDSSNEEPTNLQKMQPVNDSVLKEYSKSEKLTSVTLIQNYWRKMRSEDTLMDVLSKNHPFHEFFGKEIVKKSLNLQKLKQMEQAIKDGNWEDPIFQDKGYSFRLMYTSKLDDEAIEERKLYLYLVDDVLECAAKNDLGEIKRISLKDMKQNSTIINALNDPSKKRTLTTTEEKAIFNITSVKEGVYQETVPYLALSLLTSKKISQQQCLTILERHQAFKNYPLKKTYRILDDNNQFTEDAKRVLLPVFQTMQFLKPLSEEQLESFRLLVMNLPKSEQTFYTTETGDLTMQGTFGYQLAYNFDTINIRDEEVINLTNSAEHALGIARFGLEEYEVPVARLGSQSITNVEQGIREGERLQAIHYPGTIPYGDIHNSKNVTFFVAARHDFGHALGQSCTPKPFLLAYNRMIDTIRASTSYKSSKEIWSWTDRDYNYFLNNHKTLQFDINNIAETTKLWCDMLSAGDAESKFSFGGYLNQKVHPSTLGTLIYMDMLQHPDDWRNHKIDPELLIGNYKTSYEFIKTIYEYIKNDPPEIQVFKSELYYNLNLEGKKEEFIRINELISNHPKQIKSLLDWKKYIRTSSDNFHPTNSTYLSFNGIPIEYIHGNVYDFIKANIDNPANTDTKLLGIISPQWILTMPAKTRMNLSILMEHPASLKKIDDLIQTCGLTSEHIQKPDDIINLRQLLNNLDDISYVKQLLDSNKASLSDMLTLGYNKQLYFQNFGKEV